MCGVRRVVLNIFFMNVLCAFMRDGVLADVLRGTACLLCVLGDTSCEGCCEGFPSVYVVVLLRGWVGRVTYTFRK